MLARACRAFQNILQARATRVRQRRNSPAIEPFAISNKPGWQVQLFCNTEFHDIYQICGKKLGQNTGLEEPKINRPCFLKQ
jgi:hypothetical protein